MPLRPSEAGACCKYQGTDIWDHYFARLWLADSGEHAKCDTVSGTSNLTEASRLSASPFKQHKVVL
jgi:hypothetical protein